MSDAHTQPTVLFMAKDPDDRYSLKELLEAEHYEVFGRHTRERAAQLMSVYSLDLILIDLDLHESTGIEYCRYLRGTNYARVVPIIVIGADDEHGSNCVAAYEAGADDFVPTPFVFGICLAKIRYHLQGRLRSQVASSSMSVVVSAGELPGVLQFLEVEQKTGQLTIKSSRGTAVLTIDGGKLVSAQSPSVDGPEVVTEILCWDSSSVIFQEGELGEEDRHFVESMTHVIMNSSVEVDEYRAIQKQLPSWDMILVPGPKGRPGEEVTPLLRDLYVKAVRGYGRDELLQGRDYTERQATVALLQLIDDGYLAVAPPPFDEYTRGCYKAYLGKAGDHLKVLFEALQRVEFPLKLVAKDAPAAEVDWTASAPMLVVTGNKIEHGQLFIDSILRIHRAMTGKNPAARKHLDGTITYRLVPQANQYVDLVHLPAKMTLPLLKWLASQAEAIFGAMLIASDQDRFSVGVNLRLVRVLRQHFRGVMYHVVPRIMDGEVAIFKMDCEKCGYKLAVDIDGVGDTGICPICNAEIVMPDCLDNLARVMHIPREVPVVQARPDDSRHACDLLRLFLDTIIYAMQHPEKAEPRQPTTT